MDEKRQVDFEGTWWQGSDPVTLNFVVRAIRETDEGLTIDIELADEADRETLKELMADTE